MLILHLHAILLHLATCWWVAKWCFELGRWEREWKMNLCWHSASCCTSIFSLSTYSISSSCCSVLIAMELRLVMSDDGNIEPWRKSNEDGLAGNFKTAFLLCGKNLPVFAYFKRKQNENKKNTYHKIVDEPSFADSVKFEIVSSLISSSSWLLKTGCCCCDSSYCFASKSSILLRSAVISSGKNVQTATWIEINYETIWLSLIIKKEVPLILENVGSTISIEKDIFPFPVKYFSSDSFLWGRGVNSSQRTEPLCCEEVDLILNKTTINESEFNEVTQTSKRSAKVSTTWPKKDFGVMLSEILQHYRKLKNICHNIKIKWNLYRTISDFENENCSVDFIDTRLIFFDFLNQDFDIFVPRRRILGVGLFLWFVRIRDWFGLNINISKYKETESESERYLQNKREREREREREIVTQ